MMGVVASGDGTSTMPLADVFYLISSRLKNWQALASLGRLGEFARMETLIRIRGDSDGCRNRQDLEHRYACMDKMVSDLQHQRRLQTPKERGESAFRGTGWFNIAIDRDGAVICGEEPCTRNRCSLLTCLSCRCVSARS
jgi:hypothetical protein